MHASLGRLLLFLFAGIAGLVWLVTRRGVHPFFALLAAAVVVGLGAGLGWDALFAALRNGFGNILASLGFVIVLGTTLGVILEQTGATQAMAAAILRLLGARRAPLVMLATGFITGMPIFCDSGFVVLSGLNASMTRRTGFPMAVMATSLAAGLYAVHCLMPPHPGASAAASALGVDLGALILWGAGVALPAALAGFLWASWAGKKFPGGAPPEMRDPAHTRTMPAWKAFAPVVLPLVLIAARSIVPAPSPQVLRIAGEPAVALGAGLLLAIFTGRPWTAGAVSGALEEGVAKAAGILVIIGAGGAFGAVLAATDLGAHLAQGLPLASLGLLFPFLVASLLKIAQGSSTVAIITAVAIVKPLLPVLGLAEGHGPLFCALALGAGSMVFSHANDAYFWLISKFCGLPLRPMLRVYSAATACMGFTAFALVFLLHKIFGA